MSGECCCGARGPARPEKWVAGYQDTAGGRVPRVATRWTWRDRLGAWAVCWGIGRMRYAVPPGLYAVGDPSAASPVLVTANYKLSFDHVRRALAGADAWVLVLDTKGVNVWCAAGKGTFGTEELVERLAAAGVARVVGHRTLVVPQLGAPGVAAHEVARRTGFRVVYGPVRAGDLPAFLNAGMKATAAMRHVSFTRRERLAVVPVELAGRFLPAAGLALLFAGLSGLSRGGYLFEPRHALWAAAMVAANYGAGIAATPALLPWLPGRSFAGKGLATGAALGGLLAWLVPGGWVGRASVGLLSLAACSFLGLMFTGSTPYTSASGVRKEMAWALPVQGGLALVGLTGWIAARFM
jgi:acetyl-CoA decarbonylase/synthase complex subunit gamma